MEKKIAVIRGDGIGPEIVGEAIAALEAARDLDRESKIGKQAFDERERLRRARREARKYE